MSKTILKKVILDRVQQRRHLTFQLSKNVHQIAQLSNRPLNNEQVRQKRSSLFDAEKSRQLNSIPRLEKISVQYVGQPEDATLILNKNISTPYNVAQHLSEMLTERSALALVNGQLWDMHRPLEEDCSVELLHFHCEDPFHVNRVFWRSCSFLLGAAIDSAFKQDMFVTLHSFPPPMVTSGSFVSDADLSLGHSWDPTREEMMVFSAQMHRLAEQRKPFERLTVDATLALDMFSENQYKTTQIPSIAARSTSGNTVTLYKVGTHVDISTGPMMGDSSFLGRRCTIPVAHKIVKDNQPMYRFQGVALPKDVFLNHYAFGVLEKRASILNKFGLEDTKAPNLTEGGTAV